MKMLFFISAILMMITWLIGMIFFKPGMMIHALVFAAPICWIQGIIVRPKKEKLCGE